MKVDLFLGGQQGLWVLDNVDAGDIGTVYTTTPEIIIRAEKLGMFACPLLDKSGSDIGFCMHYPHLLEPDMVNAYKVVYNIHPGLLPWGRCYYPVFWALWNNEPAGATLHVIDEGIDTGPIVAQREVPKYDWDTGGTLHKRVSEAEKGLFLAYWPYIVNGKEFGGMPQPTGGSFHYRRDFFELKQWAKYGEMSGTEVVRLIRCLSHSDYTGLEVSIGGRMYEISAKEL